MASNGQLEHVGNYPAGQLYKVTTRDENWQPGGGNLHTTVEYTDKLGRTVLKRTHSANATRAADTPSDPNDQHDTYYIYDDYGNLAYVLSPEASDKVLANGSIDMAEVDDLGYQYRYDHRNRLVEKKVPGKGWEHIVYDKLDRPILTRDANMTALGQWLFTKYDAFGRVAYTGMYTSSLVGRAQVQEEARTATTTPVYNEQRSTAPLAVGDTQLYYTNSAYPTENLEVLTVSYYDSYVDSDGMLPPSSALGQPVTADAKGLPTVSRVRTLGTDDWMVSITGYDSKARPIYTKSKDAYLGTDDTVRSLLDFTGKPLEVWSTHAKGGNQNITTRDYFYYDHAARLLSHKQKIGNEPLQLIAENQYDGLGQLVRKYVGGQTLLDGYTGIEGADVTFDGTVVKTGTADAWDSGAKTRGELLADGGVTFTVLADDKRLRVGLNRPSGNGWAHHDFAVQQNPWDEDGDGHKDLWVFVDGLRDTAYLGTYQAGDTFSVERVGTQVHFKKNSSTFYTTNDSTGGGVLVGKASLYTDGASLSNLDLFGNTVDKKLQNVNYDYNIRGWLTDINRVKEDSTGTAHRGGTDLFHLKLNYNHTDDIIGGSVPTPLYNGNISQSFWQSKNEDKQVRGYDYSYDGLNRITGAASLKGSALDGLSPDIHNLSYLSYDLNGNILSLIRSGQSPSTPEHFDIWDSLTYGYDGNQLTNVSEQGTRGDTEGFRDGNDGQVDSDYEYDANGNMVLDQNKGITSIIYNHLNLPTEVVMAGGTIGYTYDATGVKKAKVVAPIDGATPKITEYAGGYVYSDSDPLAEGAMQLQFIPHPEGYIVPTVVAGEITSKSVKGFDTDTGQTTYSDYQYVFQYKDHLGNVRLSYSDTDLNGAIDPVGEIIEESNYYPFGLEQKGYNNVNTGNGNDLAQRWKHSGKELNEELGLDWYDFGARNYDPALGRWMNLDPLAEGMRRHSPYNYAFDNPVYFIDPDGMMPHGPCGDKPCPEEPSEVKNTRDKIENNQVVQALEDLGGLVDAGKKKIGQLGNRIKSLFTDNVDPVVDSGDDFVETGAETIAKETGNKAAKNIAKKTGIIGTVNTIISLGVEVSENGISEEFVQKATGELVANGTGPASGFSEVVLGDSQSDDGVTNTSNMANNFAQSGRSRNAFIFQNFTMRNSGQSQQLPADYNSVENRTERARVNAQNGTFIDRFWFRVLPPR